MKTFETNKAVRKIPVVFLVFFIAGITIAAKAARSNTTNPSNADTSVTAEISRQLNNKQGNQGLYFPLSVKRFYKQRDSAPIWTVEQKDQNKTWAAMLLIDCVLQFGLRHEDYHPKELLYATLHTILEQPGKISNRQIARFELMLTDAMLAFINNLHFGKLNPYYTPAKIDGGAVNGFDTAGVLTNALTQPAFMDAIVKVQPENKDYQAFQHQLYMIKGVYDGDCYETPEADVRKIAINMERLRWAEINDSAYIQINIPTYLLKLVRADTTFSFKVIVGKPATPTPALATSLTNFATAAGAEVIKARSTDKFSSNNLSFNTAAGGKRKAGSIYFIPGNEAGIELPGVPDQGLFRKQARATSNGSIRIERGEELAKLLLKADGNEAFIKPMHKALMNNEVKDFVLNKPLPIRVTYITAAIVDGQLVKYNDIYNLDNRVESQLYNIEPNNKKH
ncbi:hypothetical protein SNE26_02595 [Mucilaginibacter sp. cycad4]|uniref:hypothetical protein n=1 Tax=Mucilaginibacter sp. cycad4 TaxID=3342096 RepID=UPI002AAA835F|nr:hypothetical protein [Mucilaginibacter gossypii]WPV00654.1 hypothetical protein SNE26_02595 [Mucilaginibacter gossypii]